MGTGAIAIKVDMEGAPFHLKSCQSSLATEGPMPAPKITRRLATGLLLAPLFPVSARAHHGWSWAEEAQVELRGTVREVYVGQPHPTLRVEAADGLWTVELGNPSQTARAGFTAASAQAGDVVIALGNRSLDQRERRLKAVRLTVRDRTYDIYPERIRPN
jgi:hypothetical protein